VAECNVQRCDVGSGCVQCGGDVGSGCEQHATWWCWEWLCATCNVVMLGVAECNVVLLGVAECNVVLLGVAECNVQRCDVGRGCVQRGGGGVGSGCVQRAVLKAQLWLG
jgi:hypothetical protein